MANELKVKSLGKAVKVLECFSVERPELGITDISKMLNLGKTTVYNIINTFEELGYVSRNPSNEKYSLGIKLLQFSYIINHQIGFHKLFLPYMQRIADLTKETVFLGIAHGDEVLYLDSRLPDGMLPIRNILGERAPMYCTGLGKAILAFSPEVLDRLPDKFPPYTDNTIKDKAQLAEHLKLVRKQGYALDDMEHEYGVRCIGVAIRDHANQVVAAISVSGPSLRFEDDSPTRIAGIIKESLLPMKLYTV